MQASLVAFYGEKPATLVKLIDDVQKILSYKIEKVFKPYEVNQIHATISGLESDINDNDIIINRVYKKVTKQKRPINFDQLINFLQTTNIMPITIQIGGFSKNLNYNFLSHEMHPYSRSFFISKEKIIVMGWPFLNSKYQNSLSVLRDELINFNVIHRYNRDNRKDNDFYFALGKVEDIDDNTRVNVEHEIRLFLSSQNAVKIELDKDNLSIVFYYDHNMPTNTSISFKIADKRLNEATIRDLYKKRVDHD